MSRKLNSGFLFLSLAVLVIAASSAAAQIRPTDPQRCGDFATATGQSGWMLVSAPGISGPMAPVNVTPYAGWQSPALPGTSWISVNAQRGGQPGDLTFEYTFCICRQKDIGLSISFYADNGAQVFLNSTSIFSTTGSYNFNGAPKTVSYNGPALIFGTNTLRIVVHNDSGPTGLDALLKVTGGGAGCCHSTRPVIENATELVAPIKPQQ